MRGASRRPDRSVNLVTKDCAFADDLDRDVSHAVARVRDAPGGRSNDLDAFSLNVQIGQPDVGAIMAIIGSVATSLVQGLVRGIMVDVVLDEAGRSQLASNRPGEKR